ncbi:MAG: Ig-like domain-containing protein [Woeseia sp.]
MQKLFLLFASCFMSLYISPAHADILFEAENMGRVNYVIDGASPGDGWVMLKHNASSGGHLTQRFPGASGVYDIVVDVVAENDGQSHIEISVDGTPLQTFLYPLATSNREVHRLTVPAIQIENGSLFKLTGFLGYGSRLAHARVDSLRFVSTSSNPGDTTSPNVNMTSPVAGSTVAGRINVTANASDNVGVAKVQSKIDGMALGSADTTAPYSTSFDSTAYSDGSHILTAVASDAAGNSTTSAPVTINVSNSASPRALGYFAGDDVQDTHVSISGQKFLINGQPTYRGRAWNSQLIEGLLINSRMANGIYDDMDGSPPSGMLPWNPRTNTEDFILRMPSWKDQGLVAFGINFQGGSNRCHGISGHNQTGSIDNNPYDWEGTRAFDDWHANRDTPHARYLTRLGSIIRKADDLGMVVVLGLFYFGQDDALHSESSVIHATDAATMWILENKWTNVVLEIANESNVGFSHSILQPTRVPELIRRVKSISSGAVGAHLPHGRLLVSVSGGGGFVPPSSWLKDADYILLHGNGLGPSGVTSLVDKVRSRSEYIQKPRPIVFNEDSTRLDNFEAAISRYAAWGYFDSDGYQCVYSDNSRSLRWSLNAARNSGYWPLVSEITGVSSSGPTPTPIPAETEVVSLSLVDTSGNAIAGYGAISSNVTIDLDDPGLAGKPLGIRANTNPGVVGSVRIVKNGSARVENSAPYSLCGDSNGNYTSCGFKAGSVSISATPYSARNATGTAGGSLSVTITFVD